MKHIELIKDLQTSGDEAQAGDIELNRLFDGPRRTIVEVRLRNGATLKRHHAAVPITVQCLAGSGVFRAGSELEDEQKLVPGTLITLGENIEHEVATDAELHLIVSKFKPD